MFLSGAATSQLDPKKLRTEIPTLQTHTCATFLLAPLTRAESGAPVSQLSAFVGQEELENRL